VRWEPPGANGKTGEYLVELPERRQMFVEVKARGWEEEIILAEGVHSPRLRQPKYIDGEVRALAPWWSVRETVRKAYAKMPGTTPTLLIINDDLYVALNDWPLNVKIALYCPRGAGDHRDTDYLAEDGCFVGSTHERLGAVGILNVQLGAGGSRSASPFSGTRTPCPPSPCRGRPSRPVASSRDRTSDIRCRRRRGRG
jgi:hypothetical protein